MDDQQAVRVRDGIADLEEEAQARVEAEPGRRLGDRHAVDVLEDKVGAAVGGEAAAEQAGDAGVAEAGEHAALLLEALGGARGRAPAAAHHLDRHALLEGAVGALGVVDDAHAASAELAGDAVCAERLGWRLVRQQARRAAVQQRVGGAVEREQPGHLGAQRRVVPDGLVDGRVARRAGRVLERRLGDLEGAPLAVSGGCGVGHDVVGARGV